LPISTFSKSGEFGMVKSKQIYIFFKNYKQFSGSFVDNDVQKEEILYHIDRSISLILLEKRVMS
jgi:hypothetical protein